MQPGRSMMLTYTLSTAHGTKLSIDAHGSVGHTEPACATAISVEVMVASDGRQTLQTRGMIAETPLSTLHVVPLDGGDVALLDPVAQRYVCAAPSALAVGELAVTATIVGAWERFRLEAAVPNVFAAAFQHNARRLVQSGTAAAEDSAHLPEVLTGLANTTAPWSFDRAANLLLMRACQPTRRAAVVASFKNEGASVIEWLAHAWAVGFAHAFIYTNGNTDGSGPLLEALHRAGRITLLENAAPAAVSPQIAAYEHSINLLPALRDFEWAAYFDADELLVPDARHDHSVVAMIESIEALWTTERPAAICVNWQWYGSGGQTFREDGLLQERFVHSRPHTYVKSIVRLRDVASMAAIHIPDPGAVLCVTSGGERLPISTADAGRMDVSGARLNHYYHKSFEEFVVKHERGRGGVPGGLQGKDFRTFFEWDVAPLPARILPTPTALLLRVKREMAALRQLPGVADAEDLTRSVHRSLAQQVRHSALWHALRAGPAHGSEKLIGGLLAAD